MPEPGLPDFSLVQHTQTEENVPNNQNIYQITVKYTIWPFNIPTYSIASASKIYPN
jgi:hypothetical protein